MWLVPGTFCSPELLSHPELVPIALYCHPWVCTNVAISVVGGHFLHLSWLKTPFIEHANRLRAQWVFNVYDIAKCHVGMSVWKPQRSARFLSMLMFQSIVCTSANMSPSKQQDTTRGTSERVWTLNKNSRHLDKSVVKEEHMIWCHFFSMPKGPRETTQRVRK